jgi:superfamily II DNA helicase RecQ
MSFNFFKTNLIDKRDTFYVYDLVHNIIAPGERALFSPYLQKIVGETLDDRLPKNWKSDKKLIKDIKKEFWKSNFSSYAGEYFPDYYAAYYLPNNVYKIQLILLNLFRNGKLSFSENNIKLLDIGSAIGTTAWAVYDFYDILNHVLRLYGIKSKELPPLVIDSVEKYSNNINFFKQMKNKIDFDKSRVTINDPIEADVLNGGLDNLKIKKYDIIIASNMINEFPTQNDRQELIDYCIDKMNKKASLALIETAVLKDTISLKKIQHQILKNKNAEVISPCGKLNGFSERCSSCYSFRRENLIIPDIMKLFNENINIEDENEKLKWSYSVFSKTVSIDNQFKIPNSYTFLNKINTNNLGKKISISAEIVSSKILDNKYKGYYFIKICDQTEDSEKTILKIPIYFELPNLKFGDILKIENAFLEKIVWSKPSTVEFALYIDPNLTIVENITELALPKGLVSFDKVKKNDVLYFMKRIFGFENFNDGQYEIIEKSLKNEDVLGILATGGGKSLTFQLPALLKPGVSIIVSPLKSLMDDQVSGMKRRFGFDFIDRIHSGMNLIEKENVLSRLKNGKLKILYVAPERLQQKSFQVELKQLITKGININYFPIDEAHCISEWGHDFRPSYSKLKERQKDLPHLNGSFPSLIALTATASSKVQDDILGQLKLKKDENVIHRIIDRKELSLEVITTNLDTENQSYSIDYRNPLNTKEFKKYNFNKDQNKYDILEYILNKILPKRFDNFNVKIDAGIIFTIYADPQPAIDMVRQKINNDNENFSGIKESSLEFENKVKSIFNSDLCKESEGASGLSKYLNQNKLESRSWYAQPGYRKDISREEKKKKVEVWEKIKSETQEKFINNEVKLLVSTKGFGMGIDKPNIRYIIHYGFPASLESYFQQIGRAGRDKKHAHCILIWDKPTSECYEDLEKKDLPQCFIHNETTKKNEFNDKDGCPYGRSIKCDYAKQVSFIENGFPTPEEMQMATFYLGTKAKKDLTAPWIYLKNKYLKQEIGKQLKYNTKQINVIKEQSIIEKLSTLGYIKSYSVAFLKLRIRRTKTMRSIKNSTNNELIKKQIDILEVIYPGFLDSEPNTKFVPFDLPEYISKIRNHSDIKQNITVEEIVQFFNILNERDDIEVKHHDYGYEVKLDSKKELDKIKNINHFTKVDAWKVSQYAMLKNITGYADLKPLEINQKDSLCRRAHIMAVFGTESGSLAKDVKCNYCDTCGYENKWDQHANDIVADISEQKFRKDLRSFLLDVSKNNDYLQNNLKFLFSIISTMQEKKYAKLAEITCQNWMENVGEDNNPANILILSLSYKLQGDINLFNTYLDKFFISTNDPIIKTYVIKLLIEIINFNPNDIYNNHFKKKIELDIFKIFKGLDDDLEYLIGLDLSNEIIKKWNHVDKKLRSLNFNG